MKKALSLILALCMGLSLTACGGGSQPAATEAPAAEPAADAAADTAAVEYPEMTLKLSHHNAVDQPIHEALTKWATMINEQSGGKITIDIYPAASLYNQTDAQDAVQMGTLDMCLADCSQLSSAVPAFALTAMPFLYDSYETAGKVIFGEVGAQLDQQLEDTLNMHAFGWTCSALYSFFCGATVVILDSFTPKETISVIREEKVTDLYIVPSICSLLTKLATTEDMKTLRLVVSGGTTLPLQIQQDFIKKFGVDICEGYGLSETSPVVTMNPPEKPIVGSCGKIVPGIEWKLIDAEGKSVPQGEAGELIVKGENIMLGYWNLPDVTQDAMRGGWFHTGDVARADAEGYIYIVDRIKDMIISMGENIYPREVEELVYQFPGIFEAAVIGIDDKLRGQAGACFYSTHDGQDINVRELKKFLQANLALYKIPREFHLMEKLPRTSTGKIAKRMILEEFQKAKNK